MPRTAICSLVWSKQQGAYELRDRDGATLRLSGSPELACFSELIAGPSFAFWGRNGHLTLRKEQRQHGDGYWYAYRYQGRKTSKRYAGRTADLTLTRLEEIASMLAGREGEPASLEQEVSEAQPVGVSARTSAPSGNQSAPLLTPKLCPPRLPGSLVPREHLLARLNAGLERKLTVLSAPAGFGKTTLVGQWLAGISDSSVAWLALDAGDNDPLRFWRYVFGACQTFPGEPSQAALDLLAHAAQSPTGQLPLEGALTLFINDMSRLAYRSVLVLEDYHMLRESRIHETLTFLLAHLPLNFHIVLTTRVDPPLPLARLRAVGALNELRAADLRFLPGETRAFLGQTSARPLSEEDLAQIDTQVEGWVTGLRLVTLAWPVAGQGALQSFPAIQRHIFDYFVSEVLNVQPVHIQDFLLSTCILERLQGSLCDALTGCEDGAQLLESLERANLFLDSLAGNGQWYRYHALFAEAMRYEAGRRLGGVRLSVSYERASMWYEQHGMLNEAVEAALAAGGFERVARLIEMVIGQRHYHEMNGHHTLLRWLGELPEAILGQHPRLCLTFAMMRMFSLECQKTILPQHVEGLLRLAERFWEVEGNRSGMGEIYAFRALLAREQGDDMRAAQLARQALARLSEQEMQWRGTSLSYIAEEEWQAGRLHAARQTYMQAGECFEVAGNGYAMRALLFVQGDLDLLQGELRQAAELYRTVLASADKDKYDRGRALLGLARLSYEWDALEEAEQQAQEVAVLGKDLEDEPLQLRASLVQASIWQARGQSERALHLLREQLSHLRTTRLQRELAAHQARLQLAVGDLAPVERWSSTLAARRESVSLLQQEHEELVRARLLIVRGEVAKVLQRLEQRLDEARQNGRMRSELEILLLIAQASEDKVRAEQALKDAVWLAFAEGYQRLFLDEGEAMAVRLRELLPLVGKEPFAAYIRMLLLAFARQRAEQLTPLAADPVSVVLPFSGPLSQQEQRVLRLLAAGFSNQEIAEAMFVSINTVKTQVRSIYRKLNVNSRREAREVMRRQKLL